ncbi:hypothetical protein LIA77_01618 [Sarocladium implicatum]|nr:hypothetical protein LIA77_01618 [Sarocladium implicatum]
MRGTSAAGDEARQVQAEGLQSHCSSWAQHLQCRLRCTNKALFLFLFLLESGFQSCTHPELWHSSTDLASCRKGCELEAIDGHRDELHLMQFYTRLNSSSEI